MKRILYIGGFELPDKNAAAQRVLSVGKALREIGLEVRFYGITHSNDIKGCVSGFDYEAYPYPKGTLGWFKYALGDTILSYIDSQKPDYVILYNYPAIAQEKVIKYCRNRGIKTIGDITEWYRFVSFPKWVDTSLRMRVSNKHLDGIISISRYLSNFYSEQNYIQLPPLVDKSEPKWATVPQKRADDKIHLVYIGTGSVKDRLDKILRGIKGAGANRFFIDIIGITEERYQQIYQLPVSPDLSVCFHGRLPHLEALSYLMAADFQIFFRDNIRVNNAGFPTKFVESMSAGLPVITNRISNIDDYIQNGINSFMIETPEDEEIREVLVKVSQLSSDDIKKMKSNCLKDDFDYHKYVEVLASFIKSL